MPTFGPYQNAHQQFFDNNGRPLAGGQIKTFVAGTLTLQATYQDSAGLIPNTNPIVLDSSGFATIFMDVSKLYKLVASDAEGVQLWTADSVTGCGGGGSSVALSAISLSPTSVPGGSNSTGTVTLTGAAPSGGAVVTLTSANPAVATVPSSVTVPAGSTSATFTISTTAVPSATVVAISGNYGGSTQSTNLTVTSATAQPIYGGVGTAGANSSITLSGNTVVLSTGDVLHQLQTTPEAVGQSWSFSPSGQVIYLLLFGGSHTFVDANTGFTFVMNAAIAATVGGVPMFLYQSTNALYGNYKPKVVS